MMKKPIHLYILVTLSTIATLAKLWGRFTPKTFDEGLVRDTYSKLNMPKANIDDIIKVTKAGMAFDGNIVNKILALVLLVLIVATIVFLFRKKNETASYTYLAYLFVTLINGTYAYIGGRGIATYYSDEMLRKTMQATTLGGYGLGIVLFLLFSGLTVFFLLRKPKEKPSMEQTATDI
ncbi:MFS transporter [Streptococcus marmotae]|uniref:ABC transporter permease n=1 Tax=Streptococcus marmotae TaxID=1825069 RepID=UPI001F1EFBE9|nr:MFS transporter [Streptococcus marmotae]